MAQTHAQAGHRPISNVICVHGWAGDPDRNWWPWIQAEARKLGLDVDAQQFPGGENPQLPQWVKMIAGAAADKSERTVLIGHSLGCDAILRYAERSDTPIAGIILVAPYFDETDLNDLKDFGGKPIDVEKVKRLVRHKVAIFSDNDAHVPLKQGIEYQNRLGSKIIILKNKGHFTQEDGCYELPQVLAALKAMLS